MNISEIDFRALDYKEIGLWPLPLRIAVIVIVAILVFVLAYVFVLSDKLSLLETQSQQEQAKRKEFLDKYNLAANLDAYEKQMIEIKESYKKTLRELPQSDLLPELIDTISQVAENNGLKSKSIKPGKEVGQLGFYKELPLTIVLSGDYNGFGGFISDISKLSRVITLHDFSIKREGAKKTDINGALTLEIAAKTYWLSNEKTEEKPKDDKTKAKTADTAKPGAPGAPGMPGAPGAPGAPSTSPGNQPAKPRAVPPGADAPAVPEVP